MDRRQVLMGAVAGAAALWSSPWARASRQVVAGPATRLSDRVSVVEAGGTNVLALSTGDGLLLVDSGAPGSGDGLAATLGALGGNANVHTVFNTHYHLEQTGGNELFASSGARVVAHDRTHQWMSTDYWLPSENRYEAARPEAAWPTETFFNGGSMEAGGERIDYGYLLNAHTGGDIYVYLRDSNVLAVGDVASPVRDPELDWISGGWIGGRVDAMDRLLGIGNDETRVVPGSGPVLTFAEFRAERELMELVRQRLFKHVRTGDGPEHMLEAGVMEGLGRTWKEPYRFLYAAAKGLWGNHNKLDEDGI